MKEITIHIDDYQRKDGTPVSGYDKNVQVRDLTEEEIEKREEVKDKLSQEQVDSQKLQTAIDRNNGNPMELTAGGQPSQLHAKLLEEAGGDKELADLMKAQVYSDEFKGWFGDWQGDPENASKIVDENGEPLLVYHGTDGDFDEFKSGGVANGLYYGEGHYFTYVKSEAEKYSESNITKKSFLNIRNPFTHTRGELESVNLDLGIDANVDVIDNQDLFEKINRVDKKAGELYGLTSQHGEREGMRRFVEKYQNQNIESSLDLSKVAFAGGMSYGITSDSTVNRISEELGIDVETRKGLWNLRGAESLTEQGSKPKKFTEAIKKRGNDGINYGIYQIAHNSNQIKSIYNDGSFSKSNNNIYGTKISRIIKGTKYEGQTIAEIVKNSEGRKFLKDKGYFN